ncbi:Ornithine decarboxylase antizyme [Dirofilaria immitis]
MKIDKKVFIIVSRTEWCNDAIEVIFGKSAEARRNRSDAVSWITSYNYTGLMNPRSKWQYDTYLDNVTRTAHGLAKIDLLCHKRRSRLGRWILKRSIQENKQAKHRRPFTVNIYGNNEGFFTITFGVLLYAVFGICFLVANLAYLFGICIIYDASIIEENKKSKRISRQKDV